jgi:AraC-like DNA-binding protein
MADMRNCKPRTLAMKILAVDDDPLIVEWLPKIAARVGFPEVVVAMSSEEALLAIQTADHPFECLLLDMCLPSGKGIELYAQVRTLPAYREVPIIMVATLDGKVLMERAFGESGADPATESPDRVELRARPMAASACASPVEELIRHILENPRAELSLDALSEVAGVSPRQLSRLFRAEMAMSPIDYVELTRVDLARRLLEGGTTPIKAIDHFAGFGSTTTLRRAFLRRIGVAPVEYRSRRRAKEKEVGADDETVASLS